ncbi:hypothetical protein BV25DRAFT_1564476 [Artomyces pyxidatus]|uniref:Uncharacterized protein n=1 Tax=Artomyces pyxidatus TaxID=48021 RepID=A0ACB8SJX6_9AGAM|nr:hypothetical protein BV25DRAFT_1564476 [Artomyces pyxidatus]
MRLWASSGSVDARSTLVDAGPPVLLAVPSPKFLLYGAPPAIIVPIFHVIFPIFLPAGRVAGRRGASGVSAAMMKDAVGCCGSTRLKANWMMHAGCRYVYTAQHWNIDRDDNNKRRRANIEA